MQGVRERVSYQRDEFDGKWRPVCPFTLLLVGPTLLFWRKFEASARPLALHVLHEIVEGREREREQEKIMLLRFSCS